jgi:hypothetical protein
VPRRGCAQQSVTALSHLHNKACLRPSCGRNAPSAWRPLDPTTAKQDAGRKVPRSAARCFAGGGVRPPVSRATLQWTIVRRVRTTSGGRQARPAQRPGRQYCRRQPQLAVLQVDTRRPPAEAPQAASVPNLGNIALPGRPALQSHIEVTSHAWPTAERRATLECLTLELSWRLWLLLIVCCDGALAATPALSNTATHRLAPATCRGTH